MSEIIKIGPNLTLQMGYNNDDFIKDRVTIRMRIEGVFLKDIKIPDGLFNNPTLLVKYLALKAKPYVNWTREDFLKPQK